MKPALQLAQILAPLVVQAVPVAAVPKSHEQVDAETAVHVLLALVKPDLHTQTVPLSSAFELQVEHRSLETVQVAPVAGVPKEQVHFGVVTEIVAIVCPEGLIKLSLVG